LCSDNCEWIRRPTYCADQIFFLYNKILNPISYSRFSGLINFKNSRHLYTVFLSHTHRNKNNVLSQPDTITCDLSTSKCPGMQHSKSTKYYKNKRTSPYMELQARLHKFYKRLQGLYNNDVYKDMLQSNDIKVPLLASL